MHTWRGIGILVIFALAYTFKAGSWQI